MYDLNQTVVDVEIVVRRDVRHCRQNNDCGPVPRIVVLVLQPTGRTGHGIKEAAAIISAASYKAACCPQHRLLLQLNPNSLRASSSLKPGRAFGKEAFL